MKKALPLLSLLVLPLAGCNSSGDLTKTDAYEYYGLGNDKPVRLEISSAEGAPPMIGTRSFSKGEVKDGKATYIEHQTGALESQGDITFSLEKDGLYVMSSSKTELKAHTLEMPAKLDVGSGWKDHTEMSPDGKKIVLDNDIKIERKERVTTPGGTFDDALYITSTGQGTIEGKPVTLTTKSWYVRGMGPVKQIEEVETKGESKRVISIQLAAPESASTDKPSGPSLTPSSPSTPSAPSATPGDIPLMPKGDGGKKVDKK